MPVLVAAPTSQISSNVIMNSASQRVPPQRWIAARGVLTVTIVGQTAANPRRNLNGLHRSRDQPGLEVGQFGTAFESMAKFACKIVAHAGAPSRRDRASRRNSTATAVLQDSKSRATIPA